MSCPDDRWRRNNGRILSARRRLSPGDRRTVLRTAAGAALGLVLIAAATIGMAALAPVPMGQSVVLDAGTILDLGPPEDGTGRHG